MQTPAASDPSFKAFLEKLQEQNSRGFVTQLVQLKAERENAGEDNDKREEQLNDVISSLKEVRDAVTGTSVETDLTPLINIGENQTKLLEELSKEASLTRKLTEGSVEYDKEAAQYRNTSGRDIESKVSGKTSKDGGFIDFETARDTLLGQGKRVREDNAFSLKPISYAPGKTVAAAVGGKSGKPSGNEEEEKSKYQGFFNEIKSGFKFFMTDGLSEKPGHGIFQTPSKDVGGKDKEPKVSSPIQENPEADNVASIGEIQADATKSDLEVSKQMLDTTKAQLVELKAIREALAPKTPKDLRKEKSTPIAKTEESDRTGGGGGLLGGLGGMMPGMGGVGKGLMAAGKAALPWAAAAGVAVAGGAAVDYGLGKLGVGKDKEGNDLKVDTAQDDANWAKMSMGQKIQSGLARGIEKTGRALYLCTLTKEAQASRIKKETDYLNKNTPGAATKEALAAPIPTVKEKEGAAATPAAVQPEEKVKFKKSKVDQDVIGGSTIAGYERGYKLEGLEDDIKAAEAAWAKFGKAERADDKAGMDAAANEFIQVAKKIESPEYKTKMREISAKQNGKKEEKVTGGPGAKNPAVPTPEALSANQMLAQQNVARAKDKAALIAPTGNGSGTLQSGQLPVVEKKSVDTAAPGAVAAVAMGAAAPVAVKKEAGPIWKATLNDYKSSTPVDGLESQYPGIKAKFVELANNSTPRTDSRQSIETHEDVLKTKALKELTGGKSTASAKPGSAAPADATATPAVEKKPIETALGAEPEVVKEASLGERVKSEATRLGIEPGKGKGVFEGGVLTKMVDTNTGKEHNIEVSDKDKSKVAAAREMRAMNENSEKLAAAASRNLGSDVNKTSTENADMGREAGKGGSNNTVVSNSVSSNNTTKFVPMKANPRPEYTGSSLDRYTNRITVY